ncbi:transglutaminase domain-containing protein [Rhizobium bangladeshense]|uniref:transglutaminase domain-containing protein n=1 Tax=Rhizobium bangladeshense TaxID=1138189 RepID=UPI001C83DB9D|nr:transglutaminase domain-containing protein [Rhizobium bangladeshense]MBX4894616.1 transglutaminase domain-containing protein [Rhizobium bangladeshense]MBX4903499.1 transglutaminase domain-containing protein [Rhizobium bangladeshense]MBX4914810.1 transglutaminase domain-containing protein [Rhizobium bangladeshense]MBY3612527.1 transglutaminase domain-containing protein [Rhizobium bangladeshense]
MNAKTLSALCASNDGAQRCKYEHYAGHSAFSAPGRHSALLDILPSDPAGVARTAQALLIYEHAAEPFYNYKVPEARRGESHIRPMEKMLDALLVLDDRPLSVARPPEKRLVGICRHYMLLSVAILRQHGIPARGRGGFATYFNPGKFEDHWVCEYWKAADGRWALLDSQLDEVFIRNLGIGFDIHDVPRAQFLTASEAWRRCRSGELDPSLFGIEFEQLRGLWFIAGNLIRDLATLNGREVLPWDVWGAQPALNATLSRSELDFFDELALITADPDSNFDALSRRFSEDNKLRLPQTVFNALRRRQESVLEG